MQGLMQRSGPDCTWLPWTDKYGGFDCVSRNYVKTKVLNLESGFTSTGASEATNWPKNSDALGSVIAWQLCAAEESPRILFSSFGGFVTRAYCCQEQLELVLRVSC